MALFRLDCKNACAGWTVVASLVIGIVTAFLRLTGVITVTPVALLVAFGIAVVYLAVALVAAALSHSGGTDRGECPTLAVLLTGILGTVLLSVVLLAIPFAAASIPGALITGALAYFFSQTVAATACWVKALAG